MAMQASNNKDIPTDIPANTTKEQKPKKKDEAFLTVLSNELRKLFEERNSAIPKSLNKERFMQNALVVIRDSLDLYRVNPKSVALAILKGAFLGLDFFNDECYVIGYNRNIGTKDKSIWIKDAQFMTSYKGERKIARKYSIRKIRDIYAKVVREGDELVIYIDGGRQNLSFKPIPFNNGKIIGAFAEVVYEDGTTNYEEMSREEIELIRDKFSKAPKSKAWVFTPAEMFKKTVMHRLMKSIDLEFETKEQRMAFIDGMACDVKGIVEREERDEKGKIDVEIPFKLEDIEAGGQDVVEPKNETEENGEKKADAIIS